MDLIQYDWFAPINFFFYLNISLQQINGFKSVFFQEIVMKSLEKKLIPVALNVLFFIWPLRWTLELFFCSIELLLLLFLHTWLI